VPTVTPTLASIIFVAGVFAGGLGGLLGIGGGIFLVPFLNLALGLPFPAAAAISLTTVIATAIAASPNSRCSVVVATSCAVTPPSRLPAAVATSSSMPSRRLIRLRPVVADDTALDVAITVTRLIAAAVLKSSPNHALRNGTRKTPPPSPSKAPRQPAAAPDAITTATMEGVRTVKSRTGTDAGRRCCDLNASGKEFYPMFQRYLDDRLAQAPLESLITNRSIPNR